MINIKYINLYYFSNFHVKNFSSRRAFAVISDLEFFSDAMEEFGGKVGQKYRFRPEELMARSMIDEVVPIDINKLKTINDLHQGMCEVAKVL